ncbi:hypothetical protein OGAPHI_000540 [Ogataea philodendri]|uniref:Major facilitator superfamily (MFS) profile domain-containing protein n=1 Tax=Ogataea philodendri TaxID=1378263 RepID=A0A9P8PGA1_9ASCO|nr:uncharacterized protein OGAPHI_000540 [Ogataea philodendri]KAH3671317.1 hypothetical protein OGAPHI_000540 [Ogataea philodendri]
MSTQETIQKIESIQEEPKKFFESDAGDGTSRKDQYLHGTKLVMCISSIMMCMFLVALDQTISFTILVKVSESFNSYEKLTWITSSFLLALGCTAQIWGRLSIIFGRRWIMLSSIIIFEIGSLISGVAKSMDMLIGGRAMQGVGGAGIQACVMGIATEVTTIDKKPMILAMIGVVFVVASILGPIIGGLFTTYTTWRWAFYINLCFAGPILPLFLFSFRPQTPKGGLMEKVKRIDYLGAVLMIASLVLLLLPLSFGGNEYKWNSGVVIGLFVAGGVLGIAFCVWDFFFAENAVLPREIITTMGVVTSALSVSFSYAGFVVVTQFLVIYFQNIHNQTAFHAGLSLLPMVISLVLSNVVGGIVSQKTRHVKLIALVGVVLSFVGIGILTLLEKDSPNSKRYGLQVLYGLGVGLAFQPPLVAAQLACPKTPGSTILTMTFIYFGRGIATAVFSQIAQAIYTATLRTKIGHIPSPDGVNLESVINNTELLATLDSSTGNMVKQAIMESIKNTFYLSMGLVAVFTIATILMPNTRIPPKDHIEKE